MATISAGTRIVPGPAAVEYQGATVDADPARGFVLMKLSAFRSDVRARDAFDFCMEVYEEQPDRRILLDMREAYWPLETAKLAQRFREHAGRVPRSRVAVLCHEPGHDVMVAHREANVAAGHTVLYTSDEAAALAFLEAP
ncbi:hypothetical protein E5163_14040 [Marinicauda algicola]|uniref:STAS/SEC14 domain-containing protein n=1 Tax=Marinicauda algicola TaxID=2029849 RepID=A0A4S2GXQ0_9PROT|nr:hypothetical protein [Marinicauda algicola]TGY87552.1 hypothetical protein E5163_14040 [Marinicauda algicola]